MTVLSMRAIRLRAGEEFRDQIEVELEPLGLGEQRYAPVPERPEAELSIRRTASGTLFELRLAARLEGPCFRCLEPAVVPVSVVVREYQAERPQGSDELVNPYLVDDQLELSSWARDAVALELPEKILCREDCAGLCAGCGAALNAEACTCGPPEPDPRFAKLAELKERMESS